MEGAMAGTLDAIQDLEETSMWSWFSGMSAVVASVLGVLSAASTTNRKRHC
jgi:hypothetical protein